jgi:D-methionine transport system ATP-binding protein
MNPVSQPPMVRLEALRLTFAGGQKALDGVSLDVPQGSIFGIVGRSGAGKSTLLRCVNLLERPDSGRVIVDSADMLSLDRPSLSEARSRIGMVFQHFNLLSRRSAADNVALPLEISGIPASERQRRVAELLALVGLTDRANAIPAELSGGQKQRVGIARALASKPHLMLCDEATSALDPETTGEILALISDLRRKLGLTVLLITHEMAVVKAICDQVAVMEAGRIVEQGRVFDVFTRPSHATTRNFVAEVIGTALPAGTLARLPDPNPGETRVLLRILFAGPSSTRAVISEASRRFDIDINIISGRIDEISGEPFGTMAVAAYGAVPNLDAAQNWMRELGIGLSALVSEAPA